MPAAASPAIIVARFLKANHYDDTLNIFITEAGLPPDAGTVEKGDLTIEKILEEKKVFDLSLNVQKLGVEEADKRWSPLGRQKGDVNSPLTNERFEAPSVPVIVATLPTSANLLHVSVETLSDKAESQLLVATTADRRMTLLRPDAEFSLDKSYGQLQDSPILSCVSVSHRYMITLSSGMSGEIVLYDHEHDRLLEKRRDHNKYVVQVATYRAASGVHWIATAGWDGKILVYVLKSGQLASNHSLGSPVAAVPLPTNPQAVIFVTDPDGPAPTLIATRRDSTSLHYYSLGSVNPTDLDRSSPVKLELLGIQNLAPHSNAWIAFSPCSLALCPTDPSLLAVATSSVPHMKLIIVRMLSPITGTRTSGTNPALTQAMQARESLARQDREDAAIQVNISTMAPQTPYSTPQVCWRPDGSGVWVNGDDGALRGIEAKTGKIVATLKDGHEAGSKIRSIWAGWVHSTGKTVEWLVSGGFDRRLVVWKAENDDAWKVNFDSN